MLDSTRKEMDELVDAREDIQDLMARRTRLTAELATVESDLVRRRQDVQGLVDRMLGLMPPTGAEVTGIALRSRASLPARSSLPASPDKDEGNEEDERNQDEDARDEEDEEGDDEPDDEDEQDEATVPPVPPRAPPPTVARPAATPPPAVSAVPTPAELGVAETPAGIFDGPTSTWTDLQLSWMVMTPTARSTWKKVSMVRHAINHLGGKATKRQIAAELLVTGHGIADAQLGDLLGTSYFRLEKSDCTWRAVATQGPILSLKRRKIADRWFALIQILESLGGRARWGPIYTKFVNKLGPAEATRNRLNHALRDGPFAQDSDHCYTFDASLVRVLRDE